MDELLIIVFVLGLLVCLIVGAITILVWLARLFGGNNPNRLAVSRITPPLTYTPPLCNACGNPFNDRDSFCMQCGTRRGVALGSAEADLVATQRALTRLHSMNQLNDQAFQYLSNIVSDEQARLQGLGKTQVPTSPTAVVVELHPQSPISQAAVELEPLVTPERVQNIAPKAPAREPIPEPIKAEPRRSLPEMLATFMEESSIRWGELVGGLLIIGCSLALVVSLWSEIAERPFLKFSVFMSLTAVLFGLGFYSAHRWKLPTTSRGVLLTSTLLVPLNFLAVTALGRSSSGLLIILAELVAWLVFAGFVFKGAQVFAAVHARSVTMATMGAAMSLLFAKHLVSAEMHWRNWFILGALPIGCLIASVASALQQARQSEEEAETKAYPLFAVLGTGAFAVLLPLGLLFARGGLTRQAWYELVPLVAALGIPFMAVGWFLWRRLGATALANERTIAASLGLSGGVLLAGSSLIAFPFFDSMLVVALLNAAVFGWAAWRYGARLVRWVAGVQAVYSLLLILQWALGHLAFGIRDAVIVLQALTATSSGVLLIALFTVFAVAADYLRGKDATLLQEDGDLAAVLCAAFGLVLVTLNGFGLIGDPQHIVWIYAFMTIALGVLAWRRDKRWLVLLGWGLCWLTVVQTCVYAIPTMIRWPESWALAGVVMVTLAAGVALLSLCNERAQRLFGLASLFASGFCSLWLALENTMLAQQLSDWYCLPLVWAAVAWALYAWRVQSARLAVTGGLLMNLAASVMMLRSLIGLNAVGASTGLARMWQINLAVSAAYALVWHFVSRNNQPAKPNWIKRQGRLVTALTLGGLAVNAFLIVATPTRTSAWLMATGNVWGWSVCLLVAGAYWMTARNSVTHRVMKLPLTVALAFGVQLATTWHRWSSESGAAYYVLLWAVAVTAWLALALLWRAMRLGERRIFSGIVWVNGLSCASVFLAMRALASPDKPWRSIAVIAAIAVAQFGMHVLRRGRMYAYATGALSCLSLTIWIANYATGNGTMMDVLLLNGALLAAVALASLFVELRVIQRADKRLNFVLPAFHQFAAITLTCAVGLWLSLKLVSDLEGFFYRHDLVAQGRYELLLLIALTALVVGGLYDAWYRLRFTMVYWFGLVCAAAALDYADYNGTKLLWTVGVIVVAYAVMAALLWRGREAVFAALISSRVPALENGADVALWWLRPANGLLAFASVFIALFLTAGHAPLWQRVTIAATSLLAPLALGLVIGTGRQSGWRTAALAMGLGALLSCTWLLSQGKGFAQLILLAALSLLASGLFLVSEALPLPQCSIWLVRLGAWERNVRFTMRGLSVVGLAALLVTLGLEWLQFTDVGQVELAVWLKVLVTGLFVALIVSLLGFALWRGRDPFRWENLQRSRYVYAAEIAAVLLFAHVRLVAPQLFGGRFQAYWPVIILLLAFVGVALSEQLRKRGRTVLADPLSRTGVFLPLLPSLAFGLVKSNVDYAGVLLGVALFYGMLSIMRQSFGFGLLAVIAANGGWWHWLQRTGDFGFYAHPQVWLIPAALSLLAAAHINRQQLSTEQLTTLRYVSLMVIYISSTADIFLNGVADSPWLPLILAVLSIAGVLVGMMMRVRAYLFLGTAFLMLAVITMVWHAAVSFGWRWLWYVAGIAFGLMIIYLFAMFERHRAAWLLWMERFKTWQA